MLFGKVQYMHAFACCMEESGAQMNQENAGEKNNTHDSYNPKPS
jgi:hypothetical protein